MAKNNLIDIELIKQYVDITDDASCKGCRWFTERSRKEQTP